MWTWWYIKKLHSGDPKSRIVGVDKLARFGAPSTILESLFEMYSDPDKNVRYSLVCKLDELPWSAYPVGIKCLRALLFDESPCTREKALNALKLELEVHKLARQGCRDKTAGWEVPFLRECLECLLPGCQPDRTFFIGWLVHFGASTTDEEIWYDVFRGDWSEVAKRGSRAVRPLLERAKLGDGDRHDIVHAITKNDSPEVRRAVTEFFSDATQKVECRVWASDVLGKLRVREAVPALRLELRSSDEWLRRNAASTLGEIADPTSARDLVRFALPTQPGPGSKEEGRLQDLAVSACLKLLERNPHCNDKDFESAMVEALRHPTLRAKSAKHLERVSFRPKNGQDEAWYLIGLGECDRALSSSDIGLQTMLSALDQLVHMLSGSSRLTSADAFHHRAEMRSLLRALAKSRDPRVPDIFVETCRSLPLFERGELSALLASINRSECIGDLKIWDPDWDRPYRGDWMP